MRRLILPLAGLALAACGGNGGGGAAKADAGYDCSLDDRGETFTAGMSKTGDAGYQFALMDALPSPPDKGNNTWTVEVRDPNGDPVVDLDLAVKPFMPDHGHGSPTTPVITATGDGVFSVDPVYMFMPGLWEMTLSVKDTDATLDTAVFRFCVDG
jgi:hypothetical protein